MTIALRAVGEGASALEIADALSRAMCTWGKVAVLYPAEEEGSAVDGESPATAFAATVERCELDHDQVLMVCSSGRRQSAWDEFCLARADRLLAVVDASASSAANGNAAEGQGETWAAALRGADLLAYGVRPGAGAARAVAGPPGAGERVRGRRRRTPR